MNLLQTSFMGMIWFMAQLIVALFLLRVAAIKLANTNIGKGLGALVF